MAEERIKMLDEFDEWMTEKREIVKDQLEKVQEVKAQLMKQITLDATTSFNIWDKYHRHQLAERKKELRKDTEKKMNDVYNDFVKLQEENPEFAQLIRLMKQLYKCYKEKEELLDFLEEGPLGGNTTTPKDTTPTPRVLRSRTSSTPHGSTSHDASP